MALRVAQVGVGGFGRGWLKTLVETDLAELVAIVDVSEDALAAARDDHGIDEGLSFKTLAAATSQCRPEAVVCVTPPQFHTSVAVEAAQAGLHVLTEKPISDEMDSGHEMVAAADQAGVTLMVSQNYRHKPLARAVRKAVADGRIGELGSVDIRFFKGPRFGGFREEMEYPLIKDMAIHHFDFIRCVTGQDPVSVSATSWKPKWSWFRGDPSASATFILSGGAVVCYTGSWVSPEHQTSWDGDWRIEGDKGTITWVGDEVLLHSEGTAEPLSPDEPSYPNLEQSLHNFVTAIEKGTEPPTSGRDNLKSLEMVFRALEAAESGQRVHFSA